MQWFKHDSNANSDDKLQNILLDYGLEGYGLYWYCLELIVNRVDKDNITFELKHDARVIARNTGSTPQKVEEMMRRFIDLGLFESGNGAITCLKLLKRMDTSMTSNQFMREIISKAKISHDDVMTQSGFIMQEEKREDKSRKENTYSPPVGGKLFSDLEKPTRKNSLDIDDGSFDRFWSAYPKKVGKDAAVKAWAKIKPEIEIVLNALAWQKESRQWRDGYIPNPATYINGKRWNDEPVLNANSGRQNRMDISNIDYKKGVDDEGRF